MTIAFARHQGMPDAQRIAVATLGVAIDRDACRVPGNRALEFVPGCAIVNDVRAPHRSVHRPAVRKHCRDGFPAISPWVVVRMELPLPDALSRRVFVNGDLRCMNTTANLNRTDPSYRT
jgi:5-oxopent-3-ene-1,2,5-tricarboxylate decarboxylase/2-hydroxyhepta-2,4-diene-1,7-dioate isomerase